MRRRINKVRLSQFSSGKELDAFVYDENEEEYEALVAQDQLLILFFNKATLVERDGDYLLHLHTEDL